MVADTKPRAQERKIMVWNKKVQVALQAAREITTYHNREFRVQSQAEARVAKMEQKRDHTKTDAILMMDPPSFSLEGPDLGMQALMGGGS